MPKSNRKLISLILGAIFFILGVVLVSTILIQGPVKILSLDFFIIVVSVVLISFGFGFLANYISSK
ncbi:hypothetical protein DRJ16_01895 [Candidatus Woesearchaeota archaeon]|nr:MAG: hypothetical protein DRJ16_01895 [Candidatus Woesearchaeota archaeon]